MKRFYLHRHKDVHGNSGVGIVAEGIIFDSGMCAMTWLSAFPTVTVFDKVSTVQQLHGHEGKTEIIIENQSSKKFAECEKQVREFKRRLKIRRRKLTKKKVNK